ncbi:MAG: type II secretion system F family protein [Candidatus Omnitrophica bacterium]|nr:type II secretion system F family protein [Candidatus Omnitrophota bacterium]
MPTFRYAAKDQDARSLTGKIEANDVNMVIEELRKRRLIIISIDEEKPSAFFAPKSGAAGGKRIKSEDVILFARQMATMVDAGIPILQTMDALEDQASNPSFKKVLAQVRDDIRLGASLSAAFAKHNKVFDNLFVNMIKVGESGGVLTTVLERLSSYMEKSDKLKRKVTSAMVYPSVIISMAIIVTTILIIKVVPTFKSIYSSLGKDLPPMTQALLDFSDLMQQQFLFVVAGIIAAGFAFVAYKKTDKGAYQIDGVLLKLPVFGDLICKVSVSRFCRTLSVLVQSGVPILDGLDIVRKTIGNRVLERVIENVIQSVREGESIAVPLARSPVFPSMVTKMVAIGEQSGQLDKMLNKVAEFFDDRVDAAVDALTSMIEPLIIGFLGIVIGFIVMALFLPIINMTQALS